MVKHRGIPGSPPDDFDVLQEVVLPPANCDRALGVYRQPAHDLAFDPRAKLGADT
jgi:hypothetical protein